MIVISNRLKQDHRTVTDDPFSCSCFLGGDFNRSAPGARTLSYSRPSVTGVRNASNSAPASSSAPNSAVGSGSVGSTPHLGRLPNCSASNFSDPTNFGPLGSQSENSQAFSPTSHVSLGLFTYEPSHLQAFSPTSHAHKIKQHNKHQHKIGGHKSGQYG